MKKSEKKGNKEGEKEGEERDCMRENEKEKNRGRNIKYGDRRESARGVWVNNKLVSSYKSRDRREERTEGNRYEIKK